MSVPRLDQSIQASGIAEWMRTSVKAMPIIESIHVLAAATVFGTLFTALVSGVHMFSAYANTYYDITAFRCKMVALLLAGLNMMIFQLVTFRTVGGWNTDVKPPSAARVAGTLSILVWLSVIFFARWIGFAEGYHFEAPPTDVSFSF